MSPEELKILMEKDIVRQVSSDIVGNYVVYAHRGGFFLNSYGHQYAQRRQPSKRSCIKYGQLNTYIYIYVGRRNYSCSQLMLATFVRKLKKEEYADHINGDTTDNRIENLRIVDRPTNDRDGGFLRKLRYKGIDPTMFSTPFLLRYFERMAEFKRTHTATEYKNLSRDELLSMLVSPEFVVQDLDRQYEEELSNPIQFHLHND